MRGGFLHSTVLAQGLALHLEALGAEVHLEYPVRPGPRPQAIDIYADLPGLRLGIEIELEPRRVQQDLEKTRALKLDLLLIVTATRARARTIERRLRDTNVSCTPVQVMTFGAARRFLSEVSARPSLLNGTTAHRAPDLPQIVSTPASPIEHHGKD